MARIWRGFSAATLALALTACIPVTTKSPVGSTTGFKDDPQLMGVWTGSANKGGDAATIAFLAMDEGMVAVLTGIPKSAGQADAGGFYATYAIKTAALGRYRYINAHETMENGKPAQGPQAGNSFPLLYSVGRDGTLVLTLADEDAARRAVKAGKIAGHIEGGSYGDVALTAEPAALDRFFSSDAGRALFKKPFLVMHRVR